MRRGLSTLQRWIVEHAAERGHLFAAEICQGFFGWQPTYPLHRYGDGTHPNPQPRAEDGELAGDMIPFGGYHFLRRQIITQKSRAEMATLSRAVRRLINRGLVERTYFGILMAVRLTDQGREWLSGNKK
jgi:hypothetical protein